LDDNLTVGKANGDGITGNESSTKFGKSIMENASPWFYILSEAQHQWVQATQKSHGNDGAKNMIHVRPGLVGGRIVAEVLIGLMLGDPRSFLPQWPRWKLSFADNGRVGMAKAIGLG
jgi:hypothetical protein